MRTSSISDTGSKTSDNYDWRYLFKKTVYKFLKEETTYFRLIQFTQQEIYQFFLVIFSETHPVAFAVICSEV